MDGLPLKLDFKNIIGRKIYEAHISRLWMQYLLEDESPQKPNVRIEIGSDVIFTDSKGESIKIEDFGINGGLLCQLIGLTIENASRREDGGLNLNMSTGIKLEVINDTPMYESVVLHIGEENIAG